MISSFEPKFNIQTASWENFKNYVNETYPRNSFTREQKDFVHKFLKQDNGQCSDENRLWINYVADQLIDYADNWPASHEAISDQIERLQAITGKAILGLFNVQNMVRQMVPSSNRTPEQIRLLEIQPNITNYPVELTVDIGRLLNLPRARHSIQQDPGVKVEDQHLFHELHNFIVQSFSQSQNDTSETASNAASDGVGQGGEWDPRSSEDTFLRLCTYKVWCDKYEEENEWSVTKMLGPWLREAIQLYNKVSYHWVHCKVKRFDESQFHNIVNTARHSWLGEIPHRAKVLGKPNKPSSHWVTDWCTYPVTEKRHEWETYFCSVMLHAKNLAKLLGKHEQFHENEQEGVGEPAAKKARPNEEVEAEDNSMEGKLKRHIDHEFRHIRKMLVQIDRNAEVRHKEALREMLGHFNPVRNQLQHLSNGQHHMIRTLDKSVVHSK